MKTVRFLNNFFFICCNVDFLIEKGRQFVITLITVHKPVVPTHTISQHTKKNINEKLYLKMCIVGAREKKSHTNDDNIQK